MNLSTKRVIEAAKEWAEAERCWLMGHHPPVAVSERLSKAEVALRDAVRQLQEAKESDARHARTGLEWRYAK